MADNIQSAAAAPDAPELPAPSHRGLKTAVWAMGILLVVGFIVVFSTIIYRSVKLGAQDGAPPQASKRGFEPVEAAMAPGASLETVAVDGDRLAATTRLANGQGSEIILFDIRRGQELGRIRLRQR